MSDLPRLRVESGTVVLSGPWTLAEMLPLLASLRESLARVPKEVRHWDLSAVSRLDSAAAVLLWRAWQGTWPGSLAIGDMHRQVIARVAELPPEMPPPPTAFVHLPEFVGRLLFKAAANLRGMIVLFGQLLLDCLYLARHPVDIPWREFTANVYKAGALALPVTALVGFLMFGNLLRECGVLNALSETAQNVLANLITIVLGLTVAGQMTADKFVRPDTLLILALGLVAFIFDTAGGVFFAKLLNLFLPEGKKINPMIGAAGISAFPMSGRVVNQMGLAEDNQNFLLMYSISVNVSGQIASVIAGGLILTLMSSCV